MPKSECKCNEMSCQLDCKRNHTHKTFSCEICLPKSEKAGEKCCDKYPVCSEHRPEEELDCNCEGCIFCLRKKSYQKGRKDSAKIVEEVFKNLHGGGNGRRLAEEAKQQILSLNKNRNV